MHGWSGNANNLRLLDYHVSFGAEPRLFCKKQVAAHAFEEQLPGHAKLVMEPWPRQKHLETLAQRAIGKDEVVNTARVEALKMFGYT
jgi:hypothetical protein